MPETQAALFELGQRAVVGSFAVGASPGQVTKRRLAPHDVHHVFGIVLPVGRHVQDPAGPEFLCQLRDEFALD